MTEFMAFLEVDGGGSGDGGGVLLLWWTMIVEPEVLFLSFYIEKTFFWKATLKKKKVFALFVLFGFLLHFLKSFAFFLPFVFLFLHVPTDAL